MKRALSSRVRAAVLAGVLAVACASPAPAQEQEGESQLSDQTVDFLTTFVKGFLIPEEIPLPDGGKLKVDRGDEAEMKKFDIPAEDKRRIIRIAYNGATAEICDRVDLQVMAYRWMKEQEYDKEKWSQRQMFFISRLFMATVMWQTGDAQAVTREEGEENGTKPETAAEVSPDKEQTCTDSRKETVKKLETFLEEEGMGQEGKG